MILVLDPVLKLEYLQATWDQEYLDKGMKQFKARVSALHTVYLLSTCVTHHLF